jgi:hypothetical protein
LPVVLSQVCLKLFKLLFKRRSFIETPLTVRFGMPPGSHTLTTLRHGSGTDVAAVKEKRPVVIQGNLAAWIALYRT